MIQQITEILKQHNILSHLNEGITICNVSDQEKGLELAKEMLYAIVDKKSVLYLSGGSLKGLYELLAKEGHIQPGAVGLVDERYGERFHENSNEKMIRDTQFLRYLQARDIPFYPILKNKSRVETASEYDKKIRELHALFTKSIGLLGIGPDGHTAGIPSRKSNIKIQNSKVYDTYDMVTHYNDTSGKYRERVTTTFLGLSMLDVLLVPVFGNNKREALELLFESGSEEEIPARFFKRPEIAAKTIFLTDQSI